MKNEQKRPEKLTRADDLLKYVHNVVWQVEIQ